jgi:hypothetical protein
MAGASPSELPRRAALGAVDTWRRLNFEQRVAAIGALLLLVSTFGPFSFVEAAIVLCGVAVLVLLRKRAEGREFHIPFGDGGVIAAAGAWSALLIVLRLPARPLGQTLLALVCAVILLVAGVAERRKRPPDDLPGPHPEGQQRGPDAVEWEEPAPRRSRGRPREAPTPVYGTPRPGEDDTAPLGEPQPRVGSSDAPTEVGRRRRRVRRATPDAATEPLGEPPERKRQLELPTEPLAETPRDPLPPPEFHLPGDEEPRATEPPPAPPPPPPPPPD